MAKADKFMIAERILTAPLAMLALVIVFAVIPAFFTVFIWRMLQTALIIVAAMAITAIWTEGKARHIAFRCIAGIVCLAFTTCLVTMLMTVAELRNSILGESPLMNSAVAFVLYGLPSGVYAKLGSFNPEKRNK